MHASEGIGCDLVGQDVQRDHVCGQGGRLVRRRSSSESIGLKKLKRPPSRSVGAKKEPCAQCISSHPQVVADSIAFIAATSISANEHYINMERIGNTVTDAERLREVVWNRTDSNGGENEDEILSGKTGDAGWRRHPYHTQELLHFKNMSKSTNTWKKGIARGCCYAMDFCNKQHSVFVGYDREGSPLLVTVKKDKMYMNALVWAQEGCKLVSVRQRNTSCWSFLIKPKKSVNNSDLIAILEEAYHSSEGCSSVAMKLSKVRPSPTLKELLCKVEDDDYNMYSAKAFKIGVMFVQPGQSREQDFFLNENGSEAFDEFLKMMGTKVELASFKGFSGGLDTENGLTGSYSFYCSWKDDCEIMYHVSTMIPLSKDRDYLGRKRFIGNDVCMIVFVDGTDEYDPSVIRSNVTQVVVVVNILSGKEKERKYRLTVYAKSSLPYFGPDLYSAIWEHGVALRNIILEKLINGRFAASQGDGFFKRMCKYRKIKLDKIVRQQLGRKTKSSSSCRAENSRTSSMRTSDELRCKREASAVSDYSYNDSARSVTGIVPTHSRNVSKAYPAAALNSESDSACGLLSDHTGAEYDTKKCDPEKESTQLQVNEDAENFVPRTSSTERQKPHRQHVTLMGTTSSGALRTSSEGLERSLLFNCDAGAEDVSSTDSSCMSTPTAHRRADAPHTPKTHPGK
eukprot:Nk52_evm22s1671 gene=Nk52_evmTU22s1671